MKIGIYIISVQRLISIVLFGCKPNNKSQLLSKKLFFSDSIFYIKNGDIEKFDIKQHNSFYKIIVPLSGECPSCLSAIDTITAMFQKLNAAFNIAPYFLMDISDTSHFKNEIYPLLPQEEFYILNIDYLFQKQNKLLVPEIRYHGILLNKENNVIYDNLLTGQKEMNIYLKEIDKVLRTSEK